MLNCNKHKLLQWKFAQYYRGQFNGWYWVMTNIENCREVKGMRNITIQFTHNTKKRFQHTYPWHEQLEMYGLVIIIQTLLKNVDPEKMSEKYRI